MGTWFSTIGDKRNQCDVVGQLFKILLGRELISASCCQSATQLPEHLPSGTIPHLSLLAHLPLHL